MTNHIEEARKLEPAGRQWAVFENGDQKTSWTPVGYGDEAGWAEVAKRYDFFTVEYRDLVLLSDAQAALAAAEERGRMEERWRCAIEPAGVGMETPPPSSHLRGEVTHEDICNTHEGGPCNCDWSVAESGLHPDDIAVDRFAAAMKAKLAKKRVEGRGGWEDKERCSNAFLSHLLFEHIQKGDPVDVGNLTMMIHQRGETVSAPEEYVAALVQLNAIVDAWEALPGGRQVKNSDVERWLAKHMGPGIDAIRGFLRRPRPDGFLPPSPQSATAKAALERT